MKKIKEYLKTRVVRAFMRGLVFDPCSDVYIMAVYENASLEYLSIRAIELIGNKEYELAIRFLVMAMIKYNVGKIYATHEVQGSPRT